MLRHMSPGKALPRQCRHFITSTIIRAEASSSSSSHKYSETLSLPTTTFPSRSSPDLIESTILPQTTTQLYEWNISRPLLGKENLFVLHDGPPYANGDLHLGHSLNKVLKDIINRYELIRGKKVFYRPGWDCHGLPIELKALENLNGVKLKREKELKKKLKASNDEDEKIELRKALDELKKNKLTPVQIRAVASGHADKTIEAQKANFKRFGVMGDWSNPYITKDNDYVINQLKIFKKLFDRGLVYRQDKPVYWGCENATALAEGELEYNESHRSTAIYVKFPISSPSPALKSKLGPHHIAYAVIWTSTPWTIPSNRAISINENLTYSILDSSNGKEKLIVAQDLVPNLIKLDGSLTEIDTVSGIELVGSQYTNPLLLDEEEMPIIGGDHVTNTAGTGLVHTAPGHGQDDYFVCLRNGIKPYSPVDDYGRYTTELHKSLHAELLGKKVLKDGNNVVISKLRALGMLWHEQEIVHSYPYDWRSKKPVIIRSTPQWFINVDKIKPDTIAALEKVGFYPERGSKRLVSFIKTRSEWCISRQRSWGVPIPVFYSRVTGEPLLTDESIDQIIKVISEGGLESWFDNEDNTPMAQKWLPEIARGGGDEYVKGTDTMDVWFDSGSSWNVVEQYLAQEGIDDRGGYLADVYLEGSDQHRGWFQSSLLIKLATDGAMLPYKKIVTHGFTLDERGNKMSKSLGNTISPDAVINGDRQLPSIGIDGLRLWVAQSDYSTDITVGPTILSRVGDNLKKIRFTLKFLLGSLQQGEFEPVPYGDLSHLDRYVLSRLSRTQREIRDAYEQFNYSKIIRELNQNMNVLLSSIYFDISKDSLYTDKTDSPRRRSIQTVLLHIYRTYISILSPILPIITQEAWNHTPDYIKGPSSSTTPFHAGWYELPPGLVDAELEKEFDIIWALRDEFKLLLDKGNRVDKLIRNSLETRCQLTLRGFSSEVGQVLQKHAPFMNDYFLTSQFQINEPVSDSIYHSEVSIGGTLIELDLAKSEYHKCPRCWKYDSAEKDSLCNRCADAIL